MVNKIEPEELKEKVNEVLNRNKEVFDLCIHNGVLQGNQYSEDMIPQLNTRTSHGGIRKVIHVTSLAFMLSTGGQFMGTGSGIIQVNIDSWLEEEYVHAYRAGVFDLDILNADREQLMGPEEAEADDAMEDNDGGDVNIDIVRAKYLFAGGSARFMFQYNMQDLRATLDAHMVRLHAGDWQEFAEEAVPTRKSSVNALMQRFQLWSSPASKYVLMRTYKKCGEQLVMSLRALAEDTNNPVLAGWAFELEQLQLIRMSLRSTIPEEVTNGNGLQFRPSAQVQFDGISIANGNVQGGTIIWCQKWNQGCFDVALYENRTLVTFQFTLSKRHSVKLKYLQMLADSLNRLNVNVQRHVHIGLRERDWEQFEFDPPEGRGRAFHYIVEFYRSPPLVTTAETRGFLCAVPGDRLPDLPRRRR
jgi:hypothetical protein